MEGVIIGFDEYMNLVLDESEEVNVKSGHRKPCGKIINTCYSTLALVCCVLKIYSKALSKHHIILGFTGRILLKGDNITLIQTSIPG